ncbi:MAG: CHAD domain-containing protein [Thermomicrobiales bacterium]
MAPAGAQLTDIDPEQDYRSAMHALIADSWESVWDAVPAALSGDDPEGVHDVRVASRRLRAAMDVAADAFPKRWYRSLHQTAKAITRALGEVRDREVILEALSKERKRAKAAERAGLDRLIARGEREHDEARLEMVAFLAELDAKGVREESRRRFPLPADAPKASRSSKKGNRA